MMKNHIEIVFDRNIFKAFWHYECYYTTKTGFKYFQPRTRLIFVANTKDLAEQRAKDFIESHSGIEGFVFL